MIDKSSATPVYQEFQRFRDVAFSGQSVSEVKDALIYWLTKECDDGDLMADELGLELTDERAVKKTMKQAVIASVFSGNQSNSITVRGELSLMGVVKKTMSYWYPNVYKFWAIMKRNRQNRKPYEVSHKRLQALLLQSIEAHFVIDVVAKRITKEHPDVPIFPVHDALYTTAEHSEYVHRVILEESESMFGARVTVEEQ